MESLADNGNSYYAYVDTIDENEKIFDEELVPTCRLLPWMPRCR